MSIPHTRARRPRAQYRDGGFTLIELVIAIVLSGIIAGVVVAALFTSLNASRSTTAQVNDSADTGLISAFLFRDAQSSGGIDPTSARPDTTLGVSKSDAAGCAAGGAPLLVRFSWIDYTPSPGPRVVVTYTFDSATKVLTRSTCNDGASASTVVLASHITSAVVRCLPDASCAGRPESVSLEVVGSGDGAPTSTYTAPLRSASSQLAISGPSSMATGQVGMAYPSTQAATIGSLGSVAWSGSSLPAGLTVNAATGALEGMPQSQGTSNVVLSVTDTTSIKARTAARVYALTINPALSVVWQALPNGKVDVMYSAPSATATGGTSPYTWSSAGLPAGLSVDPMSGVVSGTPTVAGSFAVTITVADAAGASAQKSYDLVVEPKDECSSLPTTWHGEYFANNSLSGTPTVTREDADINFSWGSSSPAPGIPTNNFSVRWTRTTNFDPANYTFTLDADEGARLYIDGIRVINNWSEPESSSYTHFLTGWHAMRVEFKDRSGDAHAILTTTFASVTPAGNNGVTASSTVPNNQGWFGESNIRLNTSQTITEMSATIKVAQTTGITYHGQYQNINKDNVAEGDDTSCGFITYTFTLKQSRTIGTGSWVLAAQWDGTGTVHPTSGDTWTVTAKTSKGVRTFSGTF